MSSETNSLKDKLLSPDSKIRQRAIEQLVQTGNTADLKLLMKTVFSKRIGNTPSMAIKAIGNSGNEAAINILVEVYPNLHQNEKKLIIESVSRLGAFSSLIDGDPMHPNIQDQLWALLFGVNSDQFKNILTLDRKQFEKELESASRLTAHWKKK